MRFLIFFIIIFLSSIALSEETRFSEEKEFSSLCIAEESTGFYWEKGNWHQTNFQLYKWLVKKINQDKPRCVGDALPDLEKIFPFTSGKKRHSIQRCYDVKRFGEETSIPEYCTEYYEDDGNGDLKLTTVLCRESNMYMRPNGRFTKSNVDSIGDIPNDNYEDYTDSLSISIGYCSKL
tara:strand:- start:75 stop:608 length:534 start_codon:yes stop_codon:yes gene_type:complete